MLKIHPDLVAVRIYSLRQNVRCLRVVVANPKKDGIKSIAFNLIKEWRNIGVCPNVGSYRHVESM